MSTGSQPASQLMYAYQFASHSAIRSFKPDSQPVKQPAMKAESFSPLHNKRIFSPICKQQKSSSSQNYPSPGNRIQSHTFTSYHPHSSLFLIAATITSHHHSLLLSPVVHCTAVFYAISIHIHLQALLTTSNLHALVLPLTTYTRLYLQPITLLSFKL